MAEIETLPIDRIATEDTQVRVTLSDIIIREYAEGLTRGDVFPPIDVFFDGEAYWLADGFHRVKATTAAGLNTRAASVQRSSMPWAPMRSMDTGARMPTAGVPYTSCSRIQNGRSGITAKSPAGAMSPNSSYVQYAASLNRLKKKQSHLSARER